MTYTSLQSPDQETYQFELRIAHLYGNLMNTYGDNGNILMLKYVAEKLGARVTVDIVSLKDRFDPEVYDIAFFVVLVMALASSNLLFKQPKELLLDSE